MTAPTGQDAFVDLTALLGIVQLNAGPNVSVTWSTDPDEQQAFAGLNESGQISPSSDSAALGVRVVLDIPSIRAVGVDDSIRRYNSTNDTNDLTQAGLREFTLSIRVETESYPAALTTCERMRGRWLRKSTLAKLNAIQCALRRVGDTISVGAQSWDHKLVDAAVIEIELTYLYVEFDPIGEAVPPGNYIQTVAPLTFTE